MYRLGVIRWDMPPTSGASERSRSLWESGRRSPGASWRTPTRTPHRRRAQQLGRVRRSGPMPAIPTWPGTAGRGEPKVRIVGDGCAPRRSLRAPTPEIPAWPDLVGRAERTVRVVEGRCAPRRGRNGPHGSQRRPGSRGQVLMCLLRSRSVASDPALTSRRRRQPHQHRRTSSPSSGRQSGTTGRSYCCRILLLRNISGRHYAHRAATREQDERGNWTEQPPPSRPPAVLRSPNHQPRRAGSSARRKCRRHRAGLPTLPSNR